MNYPLKHYVSRNPINAIIAKNMVKVSLLEEGVVPFEFKASYCFSSAYEICKKLVEDSPVEIWKLPDLYRMAKFISAGRGDVDKIIQVVTLSIVHILTEHFPQEWKSENQVILDEIFDKIQHLYLSGETVNILGSEIVSPLAANTASVSAYRTLHKGTDIDYVIPFEEFIYQGTRIIEIDEITDEDAKEEWKKALANAQAEIEAKIPQLKYDDESELMSIDTKGNLAAENDSLKAENKELKAKKSLMRQDDPSAEVKRLTDENRVLKEKLNELCEWYTDFDEKYEKLSDEEKVSNRERIVFFATVLSLSIEKKSTILNNLAKFIESMCNGEAKYIGPMLSRLNNPENAQANAKAAKKVASDLLLILPKERRNDEKLTINKIIKSLKLNFPDKDEE